MSCNASLLVSNAGSTFINGTYTLAGTYKGASVFTSTGKTTDWPKILKPNNSSGWVIVSNKPFDNAPYYQAPLGSNDICPPVNVYYEPIYVGSHPGPLVTEILPLTGEDLSNITETFIISDNGKNELYQEILNLYSLDLYDITLKSLGKWSLNNALFADWKINFVTSISDAAYELS